MSRYPPVSTTQNDSQFISSSYQRSETRQSILNSNPSTRTNQIPYGSQDSDQNKKNARIHYDQLHNWLFNGLSFFSKDSQNRSNPRDKLIRLNRQQFQELSTDVYDELCRRIERGEHDGGEASGGSKFLASRDDFHPKRNQARQKLATLPRPRFKDLASDVFYELERRYPEFVEIEFNRSSPPNSKPSQQQPFTSSPSSLAQSNPSSALRSFNGASGGLVANDVIIPDKSTLVIENTDDAYDDHSSIRAISNTAEPPLRGASNERIEKMDIQKTAIGKRGSGNLSSIKYIHSNDTHSRSGSYSNGDLSRSLVKEGASPPSSKASFDHAKRISIMQSKINQLEKELSESQSRNANLTQDSQKWLKELEEEAQSWKQVCRCEEQRRKLEKLEVNFQDERRRKDDELESAHREIQSLRRQKTDLEAKFQSNGKAESQNSNNTAIDSLKAEVTELLNELKQMQTRQDQLLDQKEIHQETIRELEQSIMTHKKQYELIKTELRTLRRSTLHGSKNFLPNERFPLSDTGAIVDIHFAAFTTSIDELLQVGRSNVVTEVISVMRTVIDAVGTIDEDIQQFELNTISINSLNSDELDKLELLKDRINSTLSNLITASKNHAISFGLSPISLLDAAASHLSFSLVELVKLVGMRKGSAAEIEFRQKFHLNDQHEVAAVATVSSNSFAYANGFSNSLKRNNPLETPAPLRIIKERGTQDDIPKAQDELRYPNKTINGVSSSHQIGYNSSKEINGPYQSQQSMNKFDDARSPTGFDGSNASDLRDSASGSSTTNPDKVFDSPPRQAIARGIGNDSKVIGNGIFGRNDEKDFNSNNSSNAKQQGFGLGISKADDEREKLKTYLEAQTEMIVGSIQSLLSAIRGGTQGSDEINENLTQIIKIVTSIIDICEDGLRNKSIEVNKILRDLNENCSRLSEMQDIGIPKEGFTKQIKQVMAAASFGVAKALKELFEFFFFRKIDESFVTDSFFLLTCSNK
uniref:GIT_SHD n=1 Tax=Puccinia cf. psidii AE-2014 TaxID=1505670 RepID=A0A060IHP5_9BASI|nr:GIT_SHD [Puccinia cf. psidii AE-2014]